MKNLIVLAIAVVIGLFVYRKLAGGKKTKPIANGSDLFQGPDIDPQTGAYLMPGAQPGTVQFSAQGN